MKGRVLIVAGSDSGGGAGIQADIKAVTALKAYAATAIAALTIQNTRGVFGVVEVAPDAVADQMRVVLEDIGADALKTGMLATAPVIDAVADTIASHAPRVPLVVDPVMVAKGGARLLAADTEQSLLRRLVANAALVTPNLPEAAALTGREVVDKDDMRRAAERLLRLGAGAVLLKGGHLDSAIVSDLLLTAESEHWFESPRIETRHTHGTGCTLASAIAAGLAQGLAMEHAVARARDYVQEAIRRAPGFGTGHGPLDHTHTVGDFGAGR
ncbi:bifunctional hydroxymethylpyrimidine kinase/phosphomethylpyrimidine kinase [Zavarzinia sp. CC-PAN008]|uniref:bifunctional hydroxymethylpyrimidine kinase/phosphomethylpyrimidine kinase n=1 Tax=Zavarzinia sp. CC-PAN008 TaxID=3243332 RepID=UPI003F74A0A9